MTVLLGWLQLMLVIIAAGAISGALLTAFATRMVFEGFVFERPGLEGLGLERLETIAPRSRFALLAALALLPLALGLAALAVAFAPSVLDALGLVPDHCAHHGGHAFHLCFVHGHPPDVSSVILGVAGLPLVWLAVGWFAEFGRVHHMRQWARRLTKVSAFDADLGSWRLMSQRPMAVTIGFFKPRIYISEKMRELLSASQFEAVLAHERAHARRLDALVKLVVRLGARLHFPSVRKRLLEAMNLACEQACDEAAAEAVGDRVTVAEAILAVERGLGGNKLPAAALGFGAGSLEARVQGILDADWQAPNWASLGFICALAFASVVASYDVLHHAAETLLSLLF